MQLLHVTCTPDNTSPPYNKAQTPVVFVEDGRSCVLFSPKFEFSKTSMLCEDIRCYVGCKECSNCIVVCIPIGTENETSSFRTTLHLNQTNCYSILLVFESNTDIFRDIAKSLRKLRIIFTRVISVLNYAVWVYQSLNFVSVVQYPWHSKSVGPFRQCLENWICKTTDS